MEINVTVEKGFEGYLEPSWLESVAEKVLLAQGVSPGAELGLVIAGQERVHQLNLRYLGKDEPTDVLAFAMIPESPGDGSAPFVVPPDGIEHLGEVIIAYPQAVIQSEEHRHPVEQEIVILIVHGVLHLLGYDHDKSEREREMVTREAAILSFIEGK